MASGNTIKYGTFTFTQDKIKDGTMYRSRDLLSASLEVDTLTVTVECDDSTITKFQRNAQLVRYYNDDQDGTFYVQSIKRIAPKLYTITATSKVGLLSGGQHMGGIYTGNLAGDVIKDICGDVAVAVKSNISDIKLYGWLPIATPRENLAQVLFATGATVKEDRDGTLRVEGLWDGMSSIISADRIYEDSSVDYGSDVSSVSVTEHQYAEGGELTTLFEGTAAQGDVITFSDPHYGLVATGFTIIESGANYAKVSAGSGTLQGQPYIHNTREITRTVNADAAENVKTVRNATLVSLVNSKAVAERMVNYYKCVESISAPTLYARELPGDRLGVYHPFDEAYADACLESESVTLSGTLKAQETSVVGFIPVDTNTNLVNHVEVLTGSGEWTPPEGVDEFRVVLVQGGGVGYDATGGTAPSITNIDSYVSVTSESFQWSFSEADRYNFSGSGGAGGNPGVQGKVFDAGIIQADKEKYSYACGTAGSTPGEAGGETTFDDKTSASGTVYAEGYEDIVSGITYAKPGEAGTKGASGGSRNKAGSASGDVQGGAVPAAHTDTIYKVGQYEILSASCATLGNGGGGGAGGSSGSNKGSSGKTWSPATVTTSGLGDAGTTLTVNYTFASGGIGGDGANGQAGETYGSAGFGGGGGGGNGAIPNVSASGQLQSTAGYALRNGFHWITHSPTTPVSSGGKGGAGAPGCVLVYYSLETPTAKAVQMKDKNGKKMIDKYNRLLIV